MMVEQKQARTVGGYLLEERLGQGAMGVVYAGRSEVGERVAVKILPPDLATDTELVERFRREADSAAGLPHPNVTRVLAFGNEGQDLYMVMELLDGSDLRTLIDQGRAGTVRDKLSIMVQVAEGMSFVHAHALVHRDLKPANIHVMRDGVAKIMDFGLVKLSDSEMTRAGTAMGSPAYMAPEMVRGEPADSRTDVFSLGACFYELLAGKRAFPGKGLTQILMAVMSSEPESLATAAPDVPAPVARIVEKALHKNAGYRYQTAGELHAALEVAQQVYAPV
jgi:eukaryotic-like serine/threonine-protein kinase